MADVIDFPNKQESFKELLLFLANLDIENGVTVCSVVVELGNTGICTPYFFNANAAAMAFHAFLIQKSAIEAADEP